MSNKRSSRADSMITLRARMAGKNTEHWTNIPMWACCTKHWLLPNFYATETLAKKAQEELLEENITADVKRVNITITFPSLSSGDSS